MDAYAATHVELFALNADAAAVAGALFGALICLVNHFSEEGGLAQLAIVVANAARFSQQAMSILYVRETIGHLTAEDTIRSDFKRAVFQSESATCVGHCAKLLTAYITSADTFFSQPEIRGEVANMAMAGMCDGLFAMQVFCS